MLLIAAFQLLLAPGELPSHGSPASPFGVRIGTPASELQILEAQEDQVYQIRVPQPWNAFATYSATVTPEDGLCRLEARTRLLVDDSFGTRATARFHELRAALSSVYGNGRVFDVVQTGAVPRKAGDWAESVRLGERSLAAFWDEEEKSALPPGINSVRLQVGAVTWRETYLYMTVEYANFGSCSQSLRARQNSIR